MPVGQPVLDTNYKHLKIIRTWPKTTTIKTIITVAIIVAYRGKNNIKRLQTPPKKTTTNKQKKTTTKKHKQQTNKPKQTNKNKTGW